MTFKKGEFQFAALKLSSPSSMNIHFGIQCSSETQACQICGALLPLKKSTMHADCKITNASRCHEFIHTNLLHQSGSKGFQKAH